MNIIAIIPARMGSSRFPGKPLALINGIPMIEIVYKNTSLCNLVNFTYVATCDDEIKNHIESINGNCIMTSNVHERATERTSEALLNIEKKLNQKFDIVVMVQGDEPMITSNLIKKSLLPFLSDDKINVVNLMSKIQDIDEFRDKNEPKVVFDKNYDALYFSREPIPSNKMQNSNEEMYKQVCVIPFKRDYLLKFNSLSTSTLEKIESIDMNRILENGDKVRMVPINETVKSVDNLNDLREVERLLKLKDE